MVGRSSEAAFMTNVMEFPDPNAPPAGSDGLAVKREATPGWLSSVGDRIMAEFFEQKVSLKTEGSAATPTL
jgi:hypothetical protein